MFKKILLLALIFSLFLSNSGLVGASIIPDIRPCPRTRANLSWPPSPLGTAITEIYHRDTLLPPAHCPRGYYFRTGVDTPMVIQYFYEWMIVLGGLAVFIAFIWAGLLYMTSVGDANKMSEAKKKIKNALFGLVLLLSSYLIFYTINPHLTRLGRVSVVEIGIGDITPDLQYRVNSFIKTYTQCLAVAEMRKRGEITIPIPILRITHNPFPLENDSEIKVGDPPGPYISFIGERKIYRCGDIPATIISPSDGFRRYVINRQSFPFPRLTTYVKCVQDGVTWNPPDPLPMPPASEARIASGAMCQLKDGLQQIKIEKYLTIQGIRMHNYGDLITHLKLPAFP